MKKQSYSLIIAWCLTALVIIAFFLPWIRPANIIAPGNSMELARDLINQEEDLFRSYIGMRSNEWQAMWREPGKGISAYQLLVLPPESRQNERAASAMLSMIWGGQGGDWRLKLVILAPLLALASAFLLLSKKPPAAWLIGLAGAQLAFYLFFRLRMNQSTTDRVLFQVDYNLGLWLTLYGLGLLALLLLLKAFLPAKWKW